MQIGIDAICNSSKDTETVGGYTEVGKREKSTHYGRECPSLPNCYTCYPPGSTLLECRLEGDQPVAHVVQVPGRGCPVNQKTCLVVETKGTEFGPLSRIVSQPHEELTRSAEALMPCQTQTSQLPMSYCLESSECRGGPVARAVIVPTNNCPSSKVTTMETTNEGHYDKPTSKIVYGPTIKETTAPICNDEPVTVINCKANRKQTAVRLTRCLVNANPGAKTHFETCVARDGSCPTTMGFVRPCDQDPTQQSVVETSIDECGISNACMDTCSQDDKFCGCLESRPCKAGPTAKITQHNARDTVQDTRPVVNRFEESTEKVYRTPPDCVVTCSGYKKPRFKCPAKDFHPRIERRNGLDPGDQEYTSNPFKRPIKKQRQVCPRHCCPPIHKPKSTSHGQCQRAQSAISRLSEHCLPIERPKSCLDSPSRLKYQPDSGDHASQPMGMFVPCTSTVEPSHKSRTDPPDLKPIKCVLVPCTIVSKTEEEVKSEKIDREQTRKTKRCVEECPKVKVEKMVPCSKGFTVEIKSEELLTRYREYMSPNTLYRYETSRSKRNGLQDEMKLPVPRMVLELKNKEIEELCREGSAKFDAKDECPC
ncbi:uncharacterized protein LOC113464817 [Ceratina calcarata]|uniref:Uncharacterized protein LOC113464817 n=1 Tax=Ceratina calcarata TaxID=156304 RepID=A0AAJ7S7G7_9HYME|nr:uncharacterized protein LOC113464817 [Ceratina calcarata]